MASGSSCAGCSGRLAGGRVVGGAGTSEGVDGLRSLYLEDMLAIVVAVVDDQWHLLAFRSVIVVASSMEPRMHHRHFFVQSRSLGGLACFQDNWVEGFSRDAVHMLHLAACDIFDVEFVFGDHILPSVDHGCISGCTGLCEPLKAFVVGANDESFALQVVTEMV